MWQGKRLAEPVRLCEYQSFILLIGGYMAKTKITFGSLELLQLITGIALLLVGLLAIVNYNSSGREVQRFLAQTFGGRSDALDLILGILLAISGAFVAVTVFLPLERVVLLAATLLALVIWAIRIILVYFASDIFEPDFLNWAVPLAIDLVVLASLWVSCRKYLK